MGWGRVLTQGYMTRLSKTPQSAKSATQHHVSGPKGPVAAKLPTCIRFAETGLFIHSAQLGIIFFWASRSSSLWIFLVGQGLSTDCSPLKMNGVEKIEIMGSQANFQYHALNGATPVASRGGLELHSEARDPRFIRQVDPG